MVRAGGGRLRSGASEQYGQGAVLPPAEFTTSLLRDSARRAAVIPWCYNKQGGAQIRGYAVTSRASTVLVRKRMITGIFPSLRACVRDDVGTQSICSQRTNCLTL